MKSIDEVLEQLKAFGFEPTDGEMRFAWNEWIAAVGPETVRFWLPIPGVKPAIAVRFKYRFRTDDADRIDAFLLALPQFDDNAESGDNDFEQ